MTPRGIRNNNPGNIRITNTAWQGKVKENTDGAFEQFISMEYGIRALIVTLRTYIGKHKCDTIRKIINRYAPSVENNTGAYIKAVAVRTGIDTDERLIPDINTLSRIVEAICFHENGGSYITMEQIHNGWGLL